MGLCLCERVGGPAGGTASSGSGGHPAYGRPLHHRLVRHQGGHQHHPADVANENPVGLHPHLLGQLAVDLEHPLLPVDGDEKFGLDQGVDNLCPPSWDT